MNEDFEAKVFAVTGAFGNLGMAVARELAVRGARVALIDFAASPGAKMPQELEAAQLLPGVDLGSEQAAQQAITAIVAHHGRLDGLVNIAGGFSWETLEEGSPGTWDRMFHLNVRTAVNASKAALPHLVDRPGTRIVNIGAGAGIKAGAGMGPYAASKAGVARLTEALAEEYKDRHVKVNAVLPSIIDTPQNRADMPDADFSRWVTPAALAQVIVFLLSPQAEAITGALIPVAGRT